MLEPQCWYKALIPVEENLSPGQVVWRILNFPSQPHDLLSVAIACQPMSRRKNPSGHFMRSTAA